MGQVVDVLPTVCSKCNVNMVDREVVKVCPMCGKFEGDSIEAMERTTTEGFLQFLRTEAVADHNSDAVESIDDAIAMCQVDTVAPNDVAKIIYMMMV